MKKKFTAILLALTLVFTCLAVLTACDTQNGNGNVQNGLVFGKKYVYDGAINKDDPETLDYFIFNANGTGTYYCKDESITYAVSTTYRVAHDYQFKFKYTFADSDNSAVVCFYDGEFTNNSLKYEATGWGDDGDYVFSENGAPLEMDVSGWSVIITVSQNVLVVTTSKNIRTYVNEDFAKQLTNYNISTYSENK